MSTIADLVSAARALAYARELNEEKQAQTPTPSEKKDQAVIDGLSGNRFSNDLEKHLYDYRKGRPGLSRETAGKLRSIDDANAQLLQDIDPKALSNYGAYGTFMSYEKRSRFVSNVYSAAKNIATIKRSLEKIS